MNSNDPLEQLAVLRQKVTEIAEEVGLHVEAFVLSPAEVGGPHLVQAIFSINPERAFMNNEEIAEKRQQEDIDKQFEELMRQQRIESFNDKLDDIKNSGLDLLKGLTGKATDGIGLDDPDDEDV